MKKDKKCEHDFLAILHCKKCGEQFHANWLYAVKQAKIEAVEQILQRLKSTIKMRSLGKNRKEATEIVIKALKEVQEVYEKTTSKDYRKTTNMALKATEDENLDYKATIS